MEIYVNDLGQPIGDPVDWAPVDPPARAVMTGSYCRVEPLDIERHASQLFKAFAEDDDGAIWTYLPYGPFRMLADFQNWLADTCLTPDPMFFAIVDAATGNAVGMASYLRIDPKNGVIEVGHINFSPALQKTAAATEAMFLMMQHVFDAGYRRYEWKCNAMNEGSMLAAERLGFRYEGLFRQAAVVKGRNRDTAWFSILDSEWPALRDGFVAWLTPENFEDGQQIESLAMKMGLPEA